MLLCKLSRLRAGNAGHSIALRTPSSLYETSDGTPASKRKAGRWSNARNQEASSSVWQICLVHRPIVPTGGHSLRLSGPLRHPKPHPAVLNLHTESAGHTQCPDGVHGLRYQDIRHPNFLGTLAFRLEFRLHSTRIPRVPTVLQREVRATAVCKRHGHYYPVQLAHKTAVKTHQRSMQRHVKILLGANFSVVARAVLAWRWFGGVVPYAAIVIQTRRTSCAAECTLRMSRFAGVDYSHAVVVSLQRMTVLVAGSHFHRFHFDNVAEGFVATFPFHTIAFVAGRSVQAFFPF